MWQIGSSNYLLNIFSFKKKTTKTFLQALSQMETWNNLMCLWNVPSAVSGHLCGAAVERHPGTENRSGNSFIYLLFLWVKVRRGAAAGCSVGRWVWTAVSGGGWSVRQVQQHLLPPPLGVWHTPNEHISAQAGHALITVISKKKKKKVDEYICLTVQPPDGRLRRKWGRRSVFVFPHVCLCFDWASFVLFMCL